MYLDLIMMMLLTIATTVVAGLAFKRADVAFLAALVIEMLYVCFYMWQMQRSLSTLLAILRGDITDVKPVFKGTFQNLWRLLQEEMQETYDTLYATVEET